ncbi:MAG: PilZ domain-containing protein, partial [Nitrospira sp.]|nr:PilZ domain-containing protein [Nitrospira sp.]
MTLQGEEQRAEPRISVRHYVIVSGSVESEGTGMLLDLSQSGCQLESPLLMLPGLSVALRIAVPGF